MRTILMAPFYLLLYTIVIWSTYFIEGIKMGNSLLYLLRIDNLCSMFIASIKGLKTLNDNLDNLNKR